MKDIETNIFEFLADKLNKTYKIGIIHKNTLVNIADHRSTTTKKANGLNRVRGKGKITYKELFETLNKKYDFKSVVFGNKQDKEIKEVIHWLVRNFNNNNDQQLKNAIISLFVKPIYNRQYGSNKESTIRAKGFDWVLMDTGSFIKQIEVEEEK